MFAKYTSDGAESRTHEGLKPLRVIKANNAITWPTAGTFAFPKKRYGRQISTGRDADEGPLVVGELRGKSRDLATRREGVPGVHVDARGHAGRGGQDPRLGGGGAKAGKTG